MLVRVTSPQVEAGLKALQAQMQEERSVQEGLTDTQRRWPVTMSEVLERLLTLGYDVTATS